MILCCGLLQIIGGALWVKILSVIDSKEFIDHIIEERLNLPPLSLYEPVHVIFNKVAF